MLKQLPKMKELRFEFTYGHPILVHQTNNTIVWIGLSEQTLKESYRSLKWFNDQYFEMSDFIPHGMRHLYEFEHIETMRYRNY